MPLKLLLVVAHPDDECFAFGGALLLAADAGHQTHVLCLTDGQSASNRGPAQSNEELGRIRRAEFAASCQVLGVTHHDSWGLQDGQLEFAPFSETAGRLVQYIRTLKPDVILTFGPDGAVNTHPDHTLVSALTSAAYHWAAAAKRYPQAGPPHTAQRLYLLSTSYFMQGRPAPLPSPWTVTLDIRQVMQRKHEAFCQHHSQAPLVAQTKEMFEQHGQYEHYTLAATPHPQPAHPQTSLFESLTPATA
jgi:LmbE family N-acetylglucosaminyl deacetylase